MSGVCVIHVLDTELASVSPTVQGKDIVVLHMAAG